MRSPHATREGRPLRNKAISRTLFPRKLAVQPTRLHCCRAIPHGRILRPRAIPIVCGGREIRRILGDESGRERMTERWSRECGGQIWQKTEKKEKWGERWEKGNRGRRIRKFVASPEPCRRSPMPRTRSFWWVSCSRTRSRQGRCRLYFFALLEKPDDSQSILYILIDPRHLQFLVFWPFSTVPCMLWPY